MNILTLQQNAVGFKITPSPHIFTLEILTITTLNKTILKLN